MLLFSFVLLPLKSETAQTPTPWMSTGSRLLILAIVAVVVALMTSASRAALTEPLSTHPHLRCSACLAVANVVGKKMNESAKLKSTFQASHRLDAQNKVKRIDYESSELRAVEILDKICDEVEKDHVFRRGPSGVRLFSSNDTLPRARYYGKTDRKELRSITRRLREICIEITDEKDDLVISLIRKERELEPLQEGLCYAKGFKMCGTKKVEAAKEKERELYEKWKVKDDLKEAKRRAAEEAERRKKDEERMRKDEERRRERMERDMQRERDRELEERQRLEREHPPPPVPTPAPDVPDTDLDDDVMSNKEREVAAASAEAPSREGDL